MSLLQQHLDAAASGALKPVLDCLRNSSNGRDYYPKVDLGAGLIRIKQKGAFLGIFSKRVLTISISNAFDITGYRVEDGRFTNSRELPELLQHTELRQPLGNVYLTVSGLRDY